MQQNRRKFLRTAGIGTGIITGVNLPNVATVAAGNDSEYNWTSEKSDSTEIVESGTVTRRCEMGTMLGYKNTIRPEDKDYVIHEFRVDLATTTRKDYHNDDEGWQEDGRVDEHSTSVEVVQNSESEVIPNYFKDTPYVGHTPSSGDDLDYGEAAKESVKVAIGQLPYFGGFMDAYSIYKALRKDKDSDGGSNDKVSYHWNYSNYSLKVEADNYMAVWWKTPKKEWSRARFSEWVDPTYANPSTNYIVDYGKDYSSSSSSTISPSKSPGPDVPNVDGVKRLDTDTISSDSPAAELKDDVVWVYEDPRLTLQNN